MVDGGGLLTGDIARYIKFTIIYFCAKYVVILMKIVISDQFRDEKF